MKTLKYILEKKIDVFSNFNLPDFSLSLFIFNILIDPSNGMFHTKLLTFALAIFLNIKRMRFSIKPLFIICFFYVAFTVSVVLMMLRGINYDSAFINMYSTTFLTLLLFFIDPEKISIKKTFTFSCCCISLLILGITFVLIRFPVTVVFLEGNEKLKTMFMINRHKKILFWWLPSVFHRASPIIILAYADKLYTFLRAYKKRINDFIIINLFFWGLFYTGTRANMFSAILITGICYLDYVFYYRKQMFKFLSLMTVAMVVAIIGIFLLLNVKNSSSTAKDGHVISYHELFSEHPSYLLIGQGPGAWFYSKGFKRYTTNTELSYYELIRMFGGFFTIFILACYLSPFLYIKNIEKGKNLVIVMSYIAYLFIAGTNPLLIGPTGFIAWWITDYNLYRENRSLQCLYKS